MGAWAWLVALLAVAAALALLRHSDQHMVGSAVTGRMYAVRPRASRAREQAVADRLARLEVGAERLIAFLQAHHPQDPRTRTLAARWAGGLSEAWIGEAAYTLQKRDVAICMPDAYDEAAATFVLVHELGHMSIDGIGHVAEFWRAVRFLLVAAAAAGLPLPTLPTAYCGKPITVDPLDCYRNGSCGL